MADLQEQLSAIRQGKSKRIKGHHVRRDGSNFLIDGDSLSIEDAVMRLEETVQKPTGIDYDWTAFFEKPSYTHTAGILKTYRFKNKAEHAAAVEEVKKRKNYLWYGRVVKNGDRYQVNQPLLIDFDTVPDAPYTDDELVGIKKPAEPKVVDPKRWDGGLSCPFCAQQVSSTSGRTLHVKHQHPDRLQEYHDLLLCSVTKAADEPNGIVDDKIFICLHCNKKCTSQSGLTLHVKHHHS